MKVANNAMHLMGKDAAFEPMVESCVELHPIGARLLCP